jgi:hypothetical protein
MAGFEICENLQSENCTALFLALLVIVSRADVDLVDRSGTLEH